MIKLRRRPEFNSTLLSFLKTLKILFYILDRYFLFFQKNVSENLTLQMKNSIEKIDERAILCINLEFSLRSIAGFLFTWNTHVYFPLTKLFSRLPT